MPSGLRVLGATSMMLLAMPITLPAAPAVSTERRDSLEQGFAQPPPAARPRVWWHWMNGNITQEGIKADLEWMHRIGIGGIQNFDASLGTPKVVDERLEFMTPPWKSAFGYAVQTADRMGLEMAIASSPGWSESGGPWVGPAQAMKKLVWSETRIEGGKTAGIVLPKPPSVSGPFQRQRRMPLFGADPNAPPPPDYYEDCAVIAYRVPAADVPLSDLSPVISSSGGSVDPVKLWDQDGATSVSIPSKSPDAAAWIQYQFAKPQVIRGVRFGIEHRGLPVFLGGLPEQAQLQASDDGVEFRTLRSIPLNRPGVAQDPGEVTLAIPSTTAKYFRVVLTMGKALADRPDIDFGSLGIPNTAPPDGFAVTEFSLLPAAVVERFEDKAGFAIGSDLNASATPEAGADAVIARSDVLDLTGKLTSDGRLQWNAPPGRWLVLRLGYSLTGAKNSPASAEATGLEVDKLDRDAVTDYLHHYLDLYESASGGLIGRRGLQYMITDSWEAGAQNWTGKMFEEFNRLRGYDMHPWLPALTGRVVQSAAQTDRFLWDFRETLADLLIENHYRTIARALHGRGLGLYSESHESGRAFIGDGMSVKRDATVPMGAMWTQTPGKDVEQYGYDADIRESASVAHIYGQNLVAAESWTAGSGAWAWAPEYLKPTADKELAMGLNRFVIHTSVHQPLIGKAPGLGLGPFGQWFTRNETWAEQAKPWVTYLARSSYLLQQGRFVADIAYFYGEDANVTALFGDHAPDIPAGYNYDFLNAEALLTALSVDGGELKTPSGMAYRVLVLDKNAQFMTLPVLRKLVRLVSDGAVIVGGRPAASPSLSDDQGEFAKLADLLWGSEVERGGEARRSGEAKRQYGKGAVYAGDENSRALQELALQELGVGPDFRAAASGHESDVLFVHRKLDDGDLYFVDSRSQTRQNLELSFRVAGARPELWHADTGGHEALSYRIEGGRTFVPLALDPYEAVFVVFRRPAGKNQMNVRPASTQTLTRIAGPWKLRFQPDRGAPDSIQLASLSSWSDSPNTGVKYFSGAASYTAKVRAQPEWFKGHAQIWIDLGSVKNIGEVFVNGRNLGVLWKAPFRVNVTQALKSGDNELRIDVTNLWVNRLIGDQQPGAARKYTFTTMPFYKAGSPLLSSGLLGPVELQRVTRH